MTRKECIQKYNVTPQSTLHVGQPCCTRCTDYRNFDHPYCKDKTKYGKLKFFLTFTSFETQDREYGLFGYDSELMDYEHARDAHIEIRKAWDKPGRKPWNSVNLIGIDENGDYFSVI